MQPAPLQHRFHRDAYHGEPQILRAVLGKPIECFVCQHAESRTGTGFVDDIGSDAAQHFLENLFMLNPLMPTASAQHPPDDEAEGRPRWPKKA